MAIDFPNSPSVNQEFSVGTKTWVYDGIKWILKLSSSVDAETLDGFDSTYFLNTSSGAQTKSGDLILTGTGTMESLDLNEAKISAYMNNISVTTAVLIDSFSTAMYRSAEYLVQFSQGTNYGITKVLIIHNGSDVAITEYGHVEIGSPILYDFSTNFSLGNLELLVTFSEANITPVTIKFSRVAFDA